MDLISYITAAVITAKDIIHFFIRSDFVTTKEVEFGKKK